MAFNFLKNILSKKEKGFSNQEIDEFVDYLKENNLTFKEEDLEKYESPETESDLELKEENKVRQESSERLAVSVNSPVKLLWNIYNEGQQAVFPTAFSFVRFLSFLSLPPGFIQAVS